MSRAIDATEQGWLPDFLLRFGIRKLLRQRIEESREHWTDNSLQDFIKATTAQPIAISTEQANEQHYEVPAAFYQRVLGHRLKYSCCFWDESTATLDEAENRALELSCQHAQIQDGQQILELGCGWGSLSLWMAQQYPNSSITALSNSHSQREFIEAAARSKGLQNLRVVTSDINCFSPDSKFDRIVSVEMFEHVRNHWRLLRQIDDWLNPQGKLFVHIFCHREIPYLFNTFGDSNWMARHFFTGGMMPSAALLPSIDSPFHLESRWKWNGMHYAKTCREWLTRQDKSRDDLLPIFENTYGKDAAKIWFQRWRMFFIACEELFAFNRGEEWFVTHYLFNREHRAP